MEVEESSPKTTPEAAPISNTVASNSLKTDTKSTNSEMSVDKPEEQQSPCAPKTENAQHIKAAEGSCTPSNSLKADTISTDNEISVDKPKDPQSPCASKTENTHKINGTEESFTPSNSLKADTLSTNNEISVDKPKDQQSTCTSRTENTHKINATEESCTPSNSLKVGTISTNNEISVDKPKDQQSTCTSRTENTHKINATEESCTPSNSLKVGTISTNNEISVDKPKDQQSTCTSRTENTHKINATEESCTPSNSLKVGTISTNNEISVDKPKDQQSPCASKTENTHKINATEESCTPSNSLKVGTISTNNEISVDKPKDQQSPCASKTENTHKINATEESYTRDDITENEAVDSKEENSGNVTPNILSDETSVSNVEAASDSKPDDRPDPSQTSLDDVQNSQQSNLGVDECTMQSATTPGTPINVALLRVTSDLDFGSTMGEDSYMSFTSETSRDDETNDTSMQGKPTPKEKKKPAKRRGDLNMLDLNGSEIHDFGADKLHEYLWPQETTPHRKPEFYMLQEQISHFLGVKSFKRKYPDLERRSVEPKERVYLREQGLVTEMQCDLGLTAIRSDIVHDLLSRDYPDKYNEFLVVLKERKRLQAIEKQKEIAAQKNDKNKFEAMRQKAIKSAAEFNAMFNRERREERRAFFDLNSFEVQFPKNKFRVLPKHMTKMGYHPVALIPGQFQDSYRKYTSTELRYMPLNTAVYSVPRKVANRFADLEPLSEHESDAESVSTEASVRFLKINTDIKSSSPGSDDEEELDSDNFRDDDDLDELDSTNQGVTKEERRAEVNSKVQSIMEKLKEKVSSNASSPSRRGRDSSARTSRTSTPNVERQTEEGTPARKRRKPTEDTPSSTRESTPTPKPKRRRKSKVEKVEIECSICNGTAQLNPLGQAEVLVQCSQCKRHGHPSCLELTQEMIPIIKTYSWQCMECKSCVHCKDPQHEDKMLFCDRCDRGYHTFCVGLNAIPNGRWECPSCQPPSTPTSSTASMIPPATHSMPNATSAPTPQMMPQMTQAPQAMPHLLPGNIATGVLPRMPLGVTCGPPV